MNTEKDLLDELIEETPQEVEQPTAEETAEPTPPPAEEQPTAEPAPAPKKGRGRPKGSTKDKSAAASAGEVPPTDKSESIDDYLKDFKTAPQEAAQTAPAPEQKLPEATVILNGYMVLVIADFVIPSIISIALPMFSGYTIDTKRLKLDKDEKRELKPFADEAAKSLVLNMSPLQLFLICLGAMYTEKTITQMEKKTK